jgi:3-deoxy-D-manno-octulosonic-acid transferase
MTTLIYRLLSILLTPLINRHMRKRVAQGKEDPNRIGERHGYPSRPRPQGRLVWLHAAGTGEAMSALTLIEGLLGYDDTLHVLLTTSTVPAAKLIQQRLPKRAEHQYTPIDKYAAVQNFLDHWHPDLAIWIESEFWPNLIMETYDLGIPMLLVNGRVSPDSFRRWSRTPGLTRRMLQCFDLCIAQSLPDAGRLGTLGADNVTWVGNLKAAAPPLPAELRELERMQRAAARRPCWLAASTHPGEENAVARIHKALKPRFPELMTFIVPREPERGEEIKDTLRRAGLEVSRRTGLEPIRPETDIYLADTMGELGVFYSALPIAFIGGSLVSHGGHNPLEAARLGCAVLFGPHMENFEDDERILVEAGAALRLHDARELQDALERLLAEPGLAAEMAAKGLALTERNQQVRDALVAKIAPYLPTADALQEAG